MSAPGYFDLTKSLTAQRKALAEASKDELANHEMQHSDMRSSLNASMNATDPGDQDAFWQQLRQKASQYDPKMYSMLEPSHPGADKAKLYDQNLVAVDKLVSEAKDIQATKASAATQAEAEQKLATQKREQGIQELSGLVNPADGSINPDAYRTWAKAHPEMNAPGGPSREWISQAITSAVPIEKQPDYLITRNLQNMKPEDFSARVDALNLPPELGSRTKQLLAQALQLGDKKGALAVIKDASDQLGRSETAERTAKATAPIKVDVHNQEAADKPITMMVPDGNGGYAVKAFKPGDSIPQGAVTATGLNSMNVPTANTRGMAEKAPRVIQFVDRANQLLDENEKQLGPLSSRWNEFTAGKIGLPNKGYTQLRTVTGLLQTALMNMHVGSRGGGEIMDHFRDLIDSSKQSPQNLRDALGEIRTYAEQVAKEGHPDQQQSGSTPAPAKSAASTQGGSQQYVRTAIGPNGHKIGQKADGGWFDVQAGTRIQ